MRAKSRCGAAIVAIAAAACTPEPGSTTTCTDGVTLARPLLVLESDEASASALARVDTEGCVTERPGIALGGDPSLAWSAGRAFAVLRDRGRIAEIDPAGPTLIDGHQLDVPPKDRPPNPHDVAVASDGTLWVPRYDLGSVAVLGAGGALVATIDLSSLADDDGNPEPEDAIAVGDAVYVGLDRLSWTGSRYEAKNAASIAILDVASRSLAGTIPLGGHAPFGRLVPDPDDSTAFFVVEAGDFDVIGEHDGIERVSTTARTARLVASETALGGSPSDVAVATTTEAYAVVAGSDPTNSTSLVRFDPSTGAVGPTLASTPGEYRLWGLAVVGDTVVVGDRDPRGPRLRRFDRATCAERSAIPLAVLPPVSLVAL